MGKAQNNYVAEIRTKSGLQAIKEGQTTIYIWGICKIGSTPVFGDIFDTLYEELEKIAPAVVWVNNLKYCAPNIYTYLLSKKRKPTTAQNCGDNEFSTLITASKEIYCIRIPFKKRGKRCYIEIRCTSHKISGDIPALAKKFNIIYNAPLLDWRREYSNDIEKDKKEISENLGVLSSVIQHFTDLKLTRLTISADAIHIYKEMLGKRWRRIFPAVTHDVDYFFREAYRGGITLYNPDMIGVDINSPIYIYDRKSAYSACSLLPLPWGVPRYFRGKPRQDNSMPLYIVNINIDMKIKPLCIPCVTEQKVTAIPLNNYIVDTNGELINITVTSIDLDLIYENYEVYDIEYNYGYKFYASRKLFAPYIDKYFSAKENSRGGDREIFKALLDALTGKIAERVQHDIKIPLDRDGKIEYIDGMTEYTAPFYTPLTCFICAYQRHALVSLINEHRDVFLYSDVDSIHCTAPIDSKYIGNGLGDWKQEYIDDPVVGGRYVGAKMYILKHESGKITRRLASCPDDAKNCIEYSKFIQGMRISRNSPYAKLRLVRIKGGSCYAPIDFTLK